MEDAWESGAGVEEVTLHGFRRLRICWERRADIHEAFLKLACCLITLRQLGSLPERP
jgi:hypothetical protein